MPGTGRAATLALAVLLAGGAGAAAQELRPSPADIATFVADPIRPAPSRHFDDFKIARVDLAQILETYYQVTEDEWRHMYSHVAFGDRTGHVVLNDRRTIKWMVRPGGLAVLEFPGGARLYLARERHQPPGMK